MSLCGQGSVGKVRAQALHQTKNQFNANSCLMKKPYCIGIDLAKATFDFCALSKTGTGPLAGEVQQ